jgi:hypothetical protein
LTPLSPQVRHARDRRGPRIAVGSPDLRFARAEAAYKIQHLGNEAGQPTLADIAESRRKLEATA